MILRKKISEKQKELESLRAKLADLETKKAEFVTREEELEAAINEVSTEEEQKVVEEEVEKFEAEKAENENAASEVEKQISDIEGEVTEMERQLEEIEDQQRTVPPMPNSPAEEEKPKKKSTGKRGFTNMIRTRSLRQMNMAEREAFVNSDEVQNLLTEIRACMKDHKRSISGGAYTIGEQMIGLLKEDIGDYSKLYRYVNVKKLSGKGREIVMGTYPEAFWEECCDPIYELDQAFTKVEVDCYKVAGYFALCNALIEDSDISLVDELMVALNYAIGFALDKAILYGTGVKMPLGVVTAIAADSAGLALTNIITISAANSVGIKLFQNFLTGSGVADQDYSKGDMVWCMNNKTYKKIKAESLSVNAAGAIVAGVEKSMPVEGGAVVVLSFIPDDNVVAGYFELYVLAERKGMTIDQSEHVRFIEDQTVLRGRGRYDGKPAIPGAFVVFGINNTSPTTEIDFANPSQG
jgi:HK97 family phage major capsid protein